MSAHEMSIQNKAPLGRIFFRDSLKIIHVYFSTLNLCTMIDYPVEGIARYQTSNCCMLFL